MLVFKTAPIKLRSRILMSKEIRKLSSKKWTFWFCQPQQNVCDFSSSKDSYTTIYILKINREAYTQTLKLAVNFYVFNTWNDSNSPVPVNPLFFNMYRYFSFFFPTLTSSQPTIKYQLEHSSRCRWVTRFLPAFILVLLSVFISLLTV